MRCSFRAPALHQIAEALQKHAAAQHVRQAGDRFAVLVAVVERLRELVRDQSSAKFVFSVLSDGSE
jgi:hypothetical protein